MTECLVGTAGWTVPNAVADRFPREGNSLQRYAALFRCAEINSTFHRPHRPATFARWADSVGPDFRFSAKLPKTITHQHKLAGCEPLVDEFLAQVAGLGDHLAVLLVQLPPSLAFEPARDGAFFTALKSRTRLALVCEPRHASWFEEEPDALLRELEVARVAADPAKVEAAARSGGWRGLGYYRLHGSPVPYRSSYADGRIEAYAEAIRAEPGPVWCIFDNTASGAAAGDALALTKQLGSASGAP
jgi:uncharacterized protein YecE (DUF72 family)